MSVVLRCRASNPLLCFATLPLLVLCKIYSTSTEKPKSLLNIFEVWAWVLVFDVANRPFPFLRLYDGLYLWDFIQSEVTPEKSACVTVVILKRADLLSPNSINLQWLTFKKGQFSGFLSSSHVARGWSLLPHSDMALIHPTSLMPRALGWFFFWIMPEFQQEVTDNQGFPAGRLNG